MFTSSGAHDITTCKPSSLHPTLIQHSNTNSQHTRIRPSTTMSTSRDSPSPGQKVRQVWTPEEDQLLSEAVALGEFDFTTSSTPVNN